MYKIEVQEENGLWHDVRGASGEVRKYPTRGAAHVALQALYPVLVGLEKYAAGPQRTRVISDSFEKEDPEAAS
ncbi:MAG: hypothetical protein HKM02_06970 [Pseudomonadales bacterium]|nr:hypothetical protein [Pseudomonadales bacterium]